MAYPEDSGTSYQCRNPMGLPKIPKIPKIPQGGNFRLHALLLHAPCSLLRSIGSIYGLNIPLEGCEPKYTTCGIFGIFGIFGNFKKPLLSQGDWLKSLLCWPGTNPLAALTSFCLETTLCIAALTAAYKQPKNTRRYLFCNLRNVSN